MATMAKIVLLVLLAGVALASLRKWVTRRRRLDREDVDEMRHPLAGVLFAILVMTVLLFALFVLPGFIDQLP